MWSEYFLRPNGEVVIVGADFDQPNVDTVCTERVRVLMMLVWAAERYPALGTLLPPREPGAVDCRCLEHPDLFGPGKILCGECGGFGWLPKGGI